MTRVGVILNQEKSSPSTSRSAEQQHFAGGKSNDRQLQLTIEKLPKLRATLSTTTNVHKRSLHKTVNPDLTDVRLDNTQTGVKVPFSLMKDTGGRAYYQERKRSISGPYGMLQQNKVLLKSALPPFSYGKEQPVNRRSSRRTGVKQADAPINLFALIGAYSPYSIQSKRNRTTIHSRSFPVNYRSITCQ